jgi:hypothetical protein
MDSVRFHTSVSLIDRSKKVVNAKVDLPKIMDATI